MSEEEREIFVTYSNDELPQRWERMKWIKDLERKYKVEQTGIVPGPFVQIYQESTKSYVYGQYFASISIVSSVMDAFLSYKIDRNHYKKRAYFSATIKDAKNIISATIYKELNDFNLKFRNPVIHVKGLVGLHTLGLRYNRDKDNWGHPDDLSMTPKEASEHGIDLFLRLVTEFIK